MSQLRKEMMQKKAKQEAMEGVCDPIYEHLINEIMQEQAGLDHQSAFVVVNSFDYENEQIEDVMAQRRIMAEVFEIDRLKA